MQQFFRKLRNREAEMYTVYIRSLGYIYALLGLICVGEFFQVALFYFCIVQLVRLVRAVCLKYEVSWVQIIMQGAYFHSFWELYCVHGLSGLKMTIL